MTKKHFDVLFRFTVYESLPPLTTGASYLLDCLHRVVNFSLDFCVYYQLSQLCLHVIMFLRKISEKKQIYGSLQNL